MADDPDDVREFGTHLMLEPVNRFMNACHVVFRINAAMIVYHEPVPCFAHPDIVNVFDLSARNRMFGERSCDCIMRSARNRPSHQARDNKWLDMGLDFRGIPRSQ